MNAEHLCRLLRELEQTSASVQALLAAAREDRDAFALHVFSARKQYRHLDLHSKLKSGKDLDRCCLLTYQTAQSLGYPGGYEDWRRILRTRTPKSQ